MNRYCEVCGMGEMIVGETSTLYCRSCGAQSDQFIEEAFDADDAHMFTTTFVREKGVVRNAEQQPQLSLPPANALDVSQDVLPDIQDVIRLTQGTYHGNASFANVKTEDFSQPGGSQFGQEWNPTLFMTKDELACAVRKSYVTGVQKMLQLQLESLVKDFHVTPLICGIAGPIWLRFVASTRVFEKVWAEEVVLVAEHLDRVRREGRPRSKRRENQAETRSGGDAAVTLAAGDPAVAPSEGDAAGKKMRMRGSTERSRKVSLVLRTSFGRQLSYVWLSALKERIPLSMTLAISFLSCYIARESILPTDIRKLALDGRLPYLAAFVEIAKSAPNHIPNTVGEKQIFPMKPRVMFQPVRVLSARHLELLAASIAERIGVQLPPVNFHAICGLFLRGMGLPVEKFLPYACRLYEWYAPSGLFLSARRAALPTRVYVMAMLIITMKILYNLDGRPLQQEEKAEPKRQTRRSPRSKEDDNSRREPLYKMVTRARVRKMASGQASAGEEQLSNLVRDDVSISEEHILGNRKRSVPPGFQGSGEDERIFCAANGSKFRSTAAAFLEGQKAVGDAKVLLKRLETVKTRPVMDYDEELSRYLKYCQNVLFSGVECEAGMEPILDRFRGIYEKHITKVRNQPVVISVEEKAAASEGTDRKSARRTGSPGSSEMDAPSAGSSRTDWVCRAEVGKQTKEQEDKEKFLPAFNDESTPQAELDGGPQETRETASHRIDMMRAGFFCLRPLAHHIGSDEYTRYNFQEPSQGLIPVHEDYFRVLQACGKLIEVHALALHRCVQRIEKGLLQVESNVEKFLLGEKSLAIVKLATAVKRRKPQRRRDKVAQAENTKSAAARIQHVRDLSYL